MRVANGWEKNSYFAVLHPHERDGAAHKQRGDTWKHNRRGVVRCGGAIGIPCGTLVVRWAGTFSRRRNWKLHRGKIKHQQTIQSQKTSAACLGLKGKQNGLDAMETAKGVQGKRKQHRRTCKGRLRLLIACARSQPLFSRSTHPVYRGG